MAFKILLLLYIFIHFVLHYLKLSFISIYLYGIRYDIVFIVIKKKEMMSVQFRTYQYYIIIIYI
jgi:hypothetical protein